MNALTVSWRKGARLLLVLFVVALSADRGFGQAALGDFVWEDLTGNARQDAGEPGIANVIVQLYNCNNQLITSTNTDPNGLYFFAGLAPGNYVVRFVLPVGYLFTAANQGTDDRDSDAAAGGNSQCVTLVSGETNRTVDAGLIRPTCLGDFVWEDLNGNGIQDVGEPGISSVTVRLLGCATGSTLATTSTSANGNYLFCNLLPGSYRVEVVVPAGYSLTSANIPPDDCRDSDASQATRLTDCITLLSSTINFCTDIGLRKLPAALGDFVWHDRNGNGLLEPGEPGLSNVTVRLLDCSTSSVLATTSTDFNGLYLFTGLLPGAYKLAFIPPAGFRFAPANAGSDVLDSDADPVTGQTGCYTIAAGQTNRTADAGLHLVSPVIARNGSVLILDWAGTPAINLERSPSLSPAVWTTVPGSAGQSHMELSNSAPREFFRLVKP